MRADTLTMNFKAGRVTLGASFPNLPNPGAHGPVSAMLRRCSVFLSRRSTAKAEVTRPTFTVRNRSAFSRTELLAVICTAAVFLGAVAVWIAHSHRAPRKYICLSNLKEWGTAMAMYEKDNNERLPYAFIRYDGNHFTSWDTLVFPYVKPEGYDPKKDRAPKGVLSCPSDPLPSPDGERRRTYSMPAHNMVKYDWPPGPQSGSGVGLWWQNGKAAEMATLAALTNALNPHPQPLFRRTGEGGSAETNSSGRESAQTASEENQSRLTSAATDQAGPPEGGAPAGKLPAIRLSMITAPTHTLLLTEQVRSNNLAFSWSGATIHDPNGHVDKRAIAPEKIHGGKFNYLMVDGHVESMTPMQSIGKSDALLDPMASASADSNEKFPNVWTIRGND